MGRVPRPMGRNVYGREVINSGINGGYIMRCVQLSHISRSLVVGQ